MRIARWFQNSIDPDKWVQALLGFIFLGVGLFLVYLLGQTYRLDCQRSPQAVDCQLTTTWMKLTSLRQRDIPQLRAARLEESCDDDGCTYRVILAARRGDFPLSEIFTSEQAQQQEFANQVNAFINGSGGDALLMEEDAGWFILIPAVFVVLGIVLSLSPLFAGLRSNQN